MSFSAAWKGKDNKIYFYQGTADAGSFVRDSKKSDKLADFENDPKNTQKATKINPYKQFGYKAKYPIFSRESLIKGYPDYISLTEGFEESTFDPREHVWKAKDFEGDDWILRYKGNKIIRVKASKLMRSKRGKRYQRKAHIRKKSMRREVPKRLSRYDYKTLSTRVPLMAFERARIIQPGDENEK